MPFPLQWGGDELHRYTSSATAFSLSTVGLSSAPDNTSIESLALADCSSTGHTKPILINSKGGGKKSLVNLRILSLIGDGTENSYTKANYLRRHNLLKLNLMSFRQHLILLRIH